MGNLSRWLVVSVQNAAESARLHFCEGVRALLEDSQVVCNVTWFSDEAPFHLDGYIYKQTFFGLLVIVSRATSSTHSVRTDALRLLHWENCIKIRMDTTEMTVKVVYLAFTRTRRNRHIAEPSVYARTKKNTVFPYFLKILMFFPNI
jgi:hypothetical protein